VEFSKRSLLLMLLLGGCENRLVASGAPSVHPLYAPILIKYKPFDTIRYRKTFRLLRKAAPEHTDFTLRLQQIDGVLFLTLSVLSGNLMGVNIFDDGRSSEYPLRIRIDEDGTIQDALGEEYRGRSTVENSNIIERVSGFVNDLMPIYSRNLAPAGSDIARSTSWMGPNGRSHVTFRLAGSLSYRGIPAVRLDVDRLVYDQSFTPGTARTYPANGYLIVNPDNGAPLEAGDSDPDGSVFTEVIG
jgi:hypothetical protein